MEEILRELINDSWEAEDRSGEFIMDVPVVGLIDAEVAVVSAYNKAIDDILVDLKGLKYNTMSHSALVAHFNKLKK